MMFSTKAEYGVRVMVELPASAARSRFRWPRSPSAAACRSPTSSTSSRACARPDLVDQPARLARRLPARAPGRGDHDGRGRRGARGLDRADRVHLRGRRRLDRLRARGRPRPRLPDQAAVDPRALLDRAARCARRRSPTCLRSPGASAAHGRARRSPRSPQTNRNPSRLEPESTTMADLEIKRPARAHRGPRDPARRRPGASTAARSTR